MSAQITISREGQQYGPYSMADLTNHLESGAILPDDLAWMEGMEEWRPLREVVDIETVPEARQPPTPPPPSPPEVIPQYLPQSLTLSGVPWARKALTINIFSYTALTLWLLVSPLLGFLVALFPAIMVLTGDIYTNKINPDGSLKTWSRKFRLGPVVLCGITLLGTIFVIVNALQNIGEGSQASDGGGENPLQPAQASSTTSRRHSTSSVLEIQMQKIYDYARGAQIDVTLTNASDYHLRGAEVGADVYNAKNEYLGHDTFLARNLGARKFVTDNFYFDNIQPSQIDHWKLSLVRVDVEREGGNWQEATKSFELKLVSQSKQTNNISTRGTRQTASPKSVEEAKKLVIGTWTYTGTDMALGGFWTKWVVKEDGTVDVYTAEAIEDDWGEPNTKRWEVFSDKYVDTGERYFALRFEGEVVKSIFRQDGALIYRFNDKYVEMDRGDKFPFSK